MINISLPEEVESRLASEARRNGLDVAEYASKLLQRALFSPSIDEVLAPFRKQVAESGLSDEQLDALFESTRQDVWTKQQGNHS